MQIIPKLSNSSLLFDRNKLTLGTWIILRANNFRRRIKSAWEFSKKKTFIIHNLNRINEAFLSVPFDVTIFNHTKFSGKIFQARKLHWMATKTRHNYQRIEYFNIWIGHIRIFIHVVFHKYSRQLNDFSRFIRIRCLELTQEIENICFFTSKKRIKFQIFSKKSSRHLVIRQKPRILIDANDLAIV